MWFINYFHVQIFVLELLFCHRLERRKLFLLRFLPAAALYLALPFIVPNGFFTPYVTIGWFTFGFLIMLLLSCLLIGFCFRMNFRQVVFYGCVAHTLQHMVHCLYCISRLVFTAQDSVYQILQLLFLAAFCAVVYFLLLDRFRSSETVDMKSSGVLIFAVCSSLIVYVLSYWTSARETETVGVFSFDFLTCLMLLILLLDLFTIRKTEREQLIMERLLRQEQEQHELSRATIDVINRKCHDLKHQISALRHMDNDEQARSIGELESAVMIYDSFPKSGNAELDIVLAEKSLIAEKQHISIRCIVDGSKLSFMKLEDMYSLLGNALDNAIESTTKEENESKRIITLYAAAKGTLYSIHMENPCAAKPLFMDGLPVTTKSDTDYHGYGTRSMRYLCEKYDGALTCGWESGIFTLDMVFPL